MGKKNNVRDHAKEREWLRSLGKGNIFQGVQRLVKQEKSQKSVKRGGKKR